MGEHDTYHRYPVWVGVDCLVLVVKQLVVVPDLNLCESNRGIGHCR